VYTGTCRQLNCSANVDVQYCGVISSNDTSKVKLLFRENLNPTQVFHQSANVIAHSVLIGATLLPFFLIVLTYIIMGSSYKINQFVACINRAMKIIAARGAGAYGPITIDKRPPDSPPPPSKKGQP
jgi:hypothetical protein